MNLHYTNTVRKADKNSLFPSLTNVLSGGFTPYVLFFAIICAVYAASLMFGLTDLDDVALIVHQRSYLQDPFNIIASFFKSVFNESGDTFYRPLLTASWIADTVIGGGRLWVYHLSGIIYHFIAVSILFNLLKNLKIEHPKAFVFSSFFAVLPIFNQAVSWIPGRNDILLAVFIFSSFIFIVKYGKNSNPANLAAAAVFFTAALFTKETAIAAFMVFPAYIFFLAKDKTARKTVSAAFVMAFCCIVWYLMKSGFTSSGEMNIFHIVTYSKIAALKFFPATLQYISKIFFPVNLKVMPPLSFFDSAAGLIILAGIVFLLRQNKGTDYRAVFFGFFWFAAFLALPYFHDSWFMLEHRVYTAAPGLIIVLNEIRLKHEIKSIMPALLALYFMFFIAVSFINNVKFSGELDFSAAAVTENPENAKTSFLYGRRFIDSGRFQTGGYFMKRNFEKLPLKEKKKDAANCSFLGIFAWQRGDIKEAKKYLTIAAEKNTSMHQTYATLANIFVNEKRYGEALENIKKAFRLKPDNPEYFRYMKLIFEIIKDKK